MAFDGFFVRKMVRELEESIVNGRINKVNNLSTDEFIFSVRKGKNFPLWEKCLKHNCFRHSELLRP